MNLSGLCCAAATRASPNVHFRLKSAFPPSVLPPYLLLIAGCKSLMPSPLSGSQRVHARFQSITFRLRVHISHWKTLMGVRRGPAGERKRELMNFSWPCMWEGSYQYSGQYTVQYCSAHSPGVYGQGKAVEKRTLLDCSLGEAMLRKPW